MRKTKFNMKAASFNLVALGGSINVYAKHGRHPNVFTYRVMKNNIQSKCVIRIGNKLRKFVQVEILPYLYRHTNEHVLKDCISNAVRRVIYSCTNSALSKIFIF